MASKTHTVMATQKEIDAALIEAKKFAAQDRRVVKAEYAADTDEVRLYFGDGVKVLLPRKKLQGLTSATRAQLSSIELVGNGTGLRWPKLDVDHYVPGLLEGVLGTRRWMAQLGRMGGSATSDAKTRAARENGKKGGRPPKRKSHKIQTVPATAAQSKTKSA